MGREEFRVDEDLGGIDFAAFCEYEGLKSLERFFRRGGRQVTSCKGMKQLTSIMHICMTSSEMENGSVTCA